MKAVSRATAAGLPRLAIWFGAALSLLAAGGCLSLKYQILKGTSLQNPPGAPLAVYVKAFPVTSKASVIDPLAAVGTRYPGQETSFDPTQTQLAEVTRPSRIEDLSGALLRELRRPELRTLVDMQKVPNLEEVRPVANPFALVPLGAPEARLEISGEALIRSQRVGSQFSQKTDRVEITVQVMDLETGRVVRMPAYDAGIRMIFNSRELEEAMAVAVATILTRKTPF